MFDESNPRFIYSVTIFLRFVTASRKSRYIIQSVLLFGCVHSIACGGLEFRIGHRTDAAEHKQKRINARKRKPDTVFGRCIKNYLGSIF
jgi:hypothetical protein